MESLKDKVAVVGMGCSKFGENWDKNAHSMSVEAVYEALEDAGLEAGDIQAAWHASLYSGDTGSQLARAMKFEFIPITRVENYCCGGLDCFRNACIAVASGTYDIVLANGAEKLLDHYGGFGKLTPDVFDPPGVDFDLPPASLFAHAATRYMAVYGWDYLEFKRVLARINIKNHHNGTLSPKSHLKREITEEEVLNAPMISWPMGLYDSCGLSDGAACAIVTTPQIAKSLRDDYVLVKAATIANGAGQAFFRNDNTLLSGGTRGNITANFPETAIASRRAYTDAGITDPRHEVSCCELHDCFSITELVTIEDLGFSPFGKAPEDIMAGRYTLQGEQPINTDGGLKSYGHPISASGLRMLYEIYKQLQGKAGPRQLKNPRFGLAHNLGGMHAFYNMGICILGCRD